MDDDQFVAWLRTGKIVVVEQEHWFSAGAGGELRHLTFFQAQVIDSYKELVGCIDPCRALRGTICIACPLEHCLHP